MLFFLQLQGAGNPPPPAIGDISLVQYADETRFYEVLLYYTDGIEKPGWGAICADQSTIDGAEVICRQMGYQFNAFTSKYVLLAQHSKLSPKILAAHKLNGLVTKLPSFN